MIAFSFFLFGLVLGVGALFFWLNKNQRQALQIKIEKEQVKKERDELLNENQGYKQKEKEQLEQISFLKADNENFKKQLENQQKHFEDKIKEKENLFKELANKSTAEFKNIAHKIFLENTKSYREESTKNLSQILKPFKEDIEGFKKSIQGFESKEKFLNETLKNFTDINSKMRDDTIKLTQALKGSSKTQGQWGEFVLENILEKSGLRKGEEFIIQQGIKDEKGSYAKPDVIVKLPDNRHIIIDAKVSLAHYISSDTKENQNSLLEKTVRSMSAHIDNLSSKKYQLFENLDTPDFVLMFIPNEGVFALATKAKNDLFEKAWQQSIVIVSPTTLYATLRTIASLWKIERQSKNAEEIAKQGGLLYDKFIGFLEDMNKIGASLKTAEFSYDSAVKKLNEGRGSLVKKVQNLKSLGVRTQKKLPSNFQDE